jgi:hypothetical protein
VKRIGHFSHLTDEFLDVCAGRPSDVARDATLRLERKANKAASLVEGEQDGSGGRKRSSVMRLLRRKERESAV